MVLFCGEIEGIFMKLVLLLADIVPLPQGLRAPSSVVDAGIQKKIRIFAATLVVSHKNLKDILKIIKSRRDSGVFTKRATKTIENEAKELSSGFLVTLLSNSAPSLLGNLLSGKGVFRGHEGISRAVQDF